MSLSGQQRIPRTPTLPQGETVAAYGTYLEAQKAVDLLADKGFPILMVTIVGTDLRMVERVTGRLSYPRAALSGFMSGAWFGLFVGLLLSLFSTPGSPSPFIPAILIGGAFGLLFSVIVYSLSRGRRDFTSASQIVATSYAILCLPEKAHQARALLQEIGGVQSGWPARQQTPAHPAVPPVSSTTPPASPSPASAPAAPPTPTAPPAPTGPSTAAAPDAHDAPAGGRAPAGLDEQHPPA